MRQYLLIILVLIAGTVHAQKGLDNVSTCMLNYHQALVDKRVQVIDLFTHNNLRYTHSNGWVETKKEQIENIKTEYLVYHSFKEDSLRVTSRSKKAQLEFHATVDVTLKGNRHTYKLNVTEVWKRKYDHWYLLARQATKMD